MPTQARVLIDNAYSRSTFNDAGVLALDSELIARIDYRQAAIFSLVNEFATPQEAYFGKEATVDRSDTGGGALGWVKPADLDTILELTAGAPGAAGIIALGTKIHLVPQDDRTAEVPPRVYTIGNNLFSVGTANDPVAAATGDKIKFFYAKLPAALNPLVAASHATNVTDTAWPTRFDALLVVDLAKYLAAKDARFAVDLPGLQTEEDTLLGIFGDHVLRNNRAMRARFGQRSRVNHLQKATG